MDRLDLKLMIHIAVESLVIAGLAYWFHRQNVALMTKLEELSHEVAIHSQLIQQIITRLGGHDQGDPHPPQRRRPQRPSHPGRTQVTPIDEDEGEDPEGDVAESQADDDDELRRELNEVEKKRTDRAKNQGKKQD
jgi:hypothetical protein